MVGERLCKDNQLKKKAVIGLDKTLKKNILKLTEEDYNNNWMAQIAVEQETVYHLRSLYYVIGLW
jgi:glucosamine-6-phosphate deaminase